MSESPVPVGPTGPTGDASLGGAGASFIIEQRYFFDPAPQIVFRIFVDRVNEWWDQRLHPEARTVIEAVPGGQFKQLWSSGGAFFGTVTHIDIPFRLRLAGPLAMARPAQSTVELTFEPGEGGAGAATVLRLRHECVGFVDDETRATYDRSWRDLIGRAFAERVSQG